MTHPSSEQRRERLVQALRGQVDDERVLAAIAAVPRELFVPAPYRDAAYEDRPLPIGAGQTISQPLIVALMAQAARLAPTDRVLDVGTGSGYQAAVLARLASQVVGVERVRALVEGARRALAEAGVVNVQVHEAGAVLGWPEGGPYEAIVVAAAAPAVPRALVEQLAPGGRLVVPVGDAWEQTLTRLTRTPQGERTERLGGCRFVPLVGEGAWSAREAERFGEQLG